MPDVIIDWAGVTVAVAVTLVIGALWYGPLFGKSWLAHIGKTREDLRAQGPALGYLVAILGSFLTAIVLTYVTQWAEAGDFAEGMAAGAVIWLGSTVATALTGGVFEGRPWGLIMINAGNALLTFMMTGGIVAAFA